MVPYAYSVVVYIEKSTDLPREEQVIKAHTLDVLHHFDGNRTHTAKALGIGLRTLQRRLKKWGINND